MAAKIVVISGRSGAGKSTAARALEDLGYFVVDNLPPQLLDNLLSLTEQVEGKINNIAIIADVRESNFLQALPSKWHSIDNNRYDKSLLYLNASEQKLIERFQESKRRHPLDDGCGLRVALSREQLLLEPIQALATNTINTDQLSGHDLRNLIKSQLFDSTSLGLNLTLLSFGFKYGVPPELDLCFDVRFLRNPYYDQYLRHQSGLDHEVFDYVFETPLAQEFLVKIIAMTEFLYPLYQAEGKANLTLAVGCTGGRHRSVAMVSALAAAFKSKIDHLRIEHRDLGRHN